MGKRQPIKTSAEEIRQYWVCKVIRHDGEEFKWTPELHDNIDYATWKKDYWEVAIDVDIPECMICGSCVPNERAHIIPQSLGGPDEPSNYMMLCPDCHRACPNTTSRKAFLSYAFKRHAMGWIAGIPRDVFVDAVNNVFEGYDEETKKEISDDVTFGHLDEPNYFIKKGLDSIDYINHWGEETNPSTIMTVHLAGIKAYIDENYPKS